MSVFADILSILDRIIEIKNYPKQRKNLFFVEVLSPLFQDLLLVHKDYIEMFEQTLDLLTSEKNLNIIADNLRNKRRELEPIRVKLANVSKTLYQSDSYQDFDEDIKKLIESICLYFPTHLITIVGSASTRILNYLDEWDGIKVPLKDRNGQILKDPKSFLHREINSTLRHKQLLWSMVCKNYATVLVNVQTK